MNKEKKPKAPGPKPDILKLKGSWTANVKKAFQKPPLGTPDKDSSKKQAP